MSKSDILQKFESLAARFLEFENDFHEIPQECQNSFSLNILKEEYKDFWEKVKVAYESFIFSKPVVDSDEDCDQAKQLHKECRLAYITVVAQINELSQSFVPAPTQCGPVFGSASSTVINSNSGHHMQFPPCTIEVFKGDYSSWPSFRDVFTAVYINCSELSNVEKLFYLRQYTEDDALEIVKNSPLTNQGFLNAWHNLSEAYENKRILVNSQLKILFNLVPVKSESAKDIKRLQWDINNCISALNLHSIDISTWDPIFVYLCSINLPVLTLSLWEQSVKNKKEIPKWQLLNNFLTERFQSLETVFDMRNSSNLKTDSEVGTNSTINKSHRNDNLRFSHKPYNRNPPIIGGRVNSFHTQVYKNNCVLCSNSHLVRCCPKFLAMEPEKRFLIVKKHNLCICCLVEGHKLNSCYTKSSCLVCKQKHNTMLHFEAKKFSTNSRGQDGPNTSRSIEPSLTVINCCGTEKQQVLLGTAMVNIVFRDKVLSVRALIDSGSQATFISERLQRKLNMPIKSISAQVSGLNGALAGSVQKQCSFILGSPLNSTFSLEVQSFVLPRLAGKLPSYSFDVSNHQFPNLKLADPCFSKSDQVDILIGADNYYKVMLSGVRKNILGNLIAQETHFGWVLTGPIANIAPGLRSTTVSFYNDIKRNKQDLKNKISLSNRHEVVKLRTTSESIVRHDHNWRACDYISRYKCCENMHNLHNGPSSSHRYKDKGSLSFDSHGCKSGRPRPSRALVPSYKKIGTNNRKLNRRPYSPNGHGGKSRRPRPSRALVPSSAKVLNNSQRAGGPRPSCDHESCKRPRPSQSSKHIETL